MALTLYTQAQVELPYQYHSSAVLIEINQGMEFGSGLLYKDSGSLYLVTAKHVLGRDSVDERKNILFNLKDHSCVLTIYGDVDTGIAKRHILHLNLIDARELGLIRIHPTQDLIAIKIAQISEKVYFSRAINFLEKQEGAQFSAFSIENLGRFSEIRPTSDIFVFGYPKSIGLLEIPQYEFNRPLVEKGIVSALNYQNKTIILSCPSYGGNSGGPVVQMRPNGLRLIGVVVQYIPYYDPKSGILLNSGYSVALPIETLLELIEN